MWPLLGVVLAAFSFTFTVFLAIAAVFLPWLLMQTSASIFTVALFLLGILTAIAILRPLVPRRIEFRPYGALLNIEREARLYEEICRMAAILQIPPPDEIYIDTRFGAGVVDHRGRLGSNRRRVLIIGLPLFAVLKLDEFRALLAHEFAHFYGGHSSFTQFASAMNRVNLVRLARLSGLPGLNPGMQEANINGEREDRPKKTILAPYWRLFLRANLWISRQIEFHADAVAARVAGGAEIARVLRHGHKATPVLLTFLNEDMGPALAARCRPPFIEGFRHRLSHGPRLRVRNLNWPWRTHPPTRDRLNAIAEYPAKNDPDGAQPATTLLNDVDAMESDLIRALHSKELFDKMRARPWSEAGVLAHLPRWLLIAAINRSVLNGWKIAEMPEVIQRIPEIAKTLPDPKGSLLAPPQRQARVHDLIVYSLVASLMPAGWRLWLMPGEFYLERGEKRLHLRRTIDRLIAKPKERVEWAEWAHHMGIGYLPIMWQPPKKD